MKTNIIVKLTYAGIHCWKDCPLELVKYLRHPHRHTFYITCKKEVNHDDRDIEIILFKKNILDYIDTVYNGDFGTMSCEMIAKDLVLEFGLNYCEVLEDNENGAEVMTNNYCSK
tara:strand:- start:266 stop:607 length:342 start_codon:yes stop_codon:yes gene_type:complete